MINAYKMMLKSNNIAIFTHSNPDGDGVACSVALKLHLQSLNKKVQLFCNDDIPAYLNFLPYVDTYKKEYNPQDNYDLIVVLDCVDMMRVGKIGMGILEGKNSVVIDHHVGFNNFATVNVSNPEASSTGEMLFDFFKENNIPLTIEIANCLLTAIIYDTSCFYHNNSTAKTLEVASQLMKFGVDKNDIVAKLLKSKTINQLNLLKNALNIARFYEDNKIVICAIPYEMFKNTNTTVTDTIGFENNFVGVECVKIAILLSEVEPKSFRVSIRTKDKFDSTAIASVFGGGGHFHASGCKIKGELVKVVDKLFYLSKSELEKND